MTAIRTFTTFELMGMKRDALMAANNNMNVFSFSLIEIDEELSRRANLRTLADDEHKDWDATHTEQSFL